MRILEGKGRWPRVPHYLAVLAQNDHCLLENVKGNGVVAESWLLRGEDGKTSTLFEVLMLPIRSLVAKETNVPKVYSTTLIVTIFFLLRNHSSVCSSPHTLQFTANYYPNVRENIKCIILNTVRQASHFTF